MCIKIIAWAACVGAAILASAGAFAAPPATGEAQPPQLARIGTWDGKTASAELAGPYEDPMQQDVPFGSHSYYLAPWRAYMDTWPASKFLHALGINFNVNDKEAPAVAAILADMGIRSARVEVGWGSFKYDDPNILNDEKALKLRLAALKEHGIRPLILLNSNAGSPCPSKGAHVKLLRPAQAGDREIYLEKTDFIVPRRTGLRGQAYQEAYPLIVNVDKATGRCELSAPLAKPPKNVEKGNTDANLPIIDLVTLRYEPFAGTVFEDGSPNPAAQETVNGWMTYVAAMCRYAKEFLGTQEAADAGFDLEVWNEYTFGSQFLDRKHYYDPPAKFREPLRYAMHGRQMEGCEIILPMTVDYANDPNNRLGGVKVISGFANQRPWESGTGLWPGQAGFSRHYYTGVNSDEWIVDMDHLHAPANQPVLNAMGIVEKPVAFVPVHLVGLPEIWHYAYQTEFMTRDIQPFPGPWRTHHRYSQPGTGQAAEVWMTETGVDRSIWLANVRRLAPCDANDPRLHALARWTGAKGILRLYTFYAHKGVDTIEMFAAKGGDQWFGTLSDGFFTALKEANYVLTDQVRRLAGPQVETITRVAKLMRTGKPLDAARPLAVGRLVEFKPRLVFAGDGTPAHPDRYHRDDFAVLPFQLDAGRFAVGYYVVTRNMVHEWNPALDILNPNRYDMPDQDFALTLTNVRGQDAKVRAWDPMTDQAVPVAVLESNVASLTVRLPAKDYPRFLLIDESPDGPMIVGPKLECTTIGKLMPGMEPSAGGKAKLSFSTNGAPAVVTWGPLPFRHGGTTTRPAGTEQPITLPAPPVDCGVQVTVVANGLTIVWPRWGWDTQGVLAFTRSSDANIQPPMLAALPPLPQTPSQSRPVNFVSTLPPGAGPWSHAPVRTLTLADSKTGNVSVALQVAGDEEAVDNLLPRLSPMDKANSKRIQWNGQPAVEADYELAAAAHPGLADLRQKFFVARVADAFVVLSFQGTQAAIGAQKDHIEAIQQGVTFETK